MKRYLSILILSIFFGILPAKADFIATQDFYVDADTTITIVVSGDLTTSINGNSGHLGTPLNINFNISSNEAANDIRMRAMITDASAVQHSAFYCTNTSAVTSQSMFLIMAEKDIEAPSILNCKNGASTVENNPCAIAYPGTVSITNNGSTVQYVENGGDGYFSARSPENPPAPRGRGVRSARCPSRSVRSRDEIHRAAVQLRQAPRWWRRRLPVRCRRRDKAQCGGFSCEGMPAPANPAGRQRPGDLVLGGGLEPPCG